MTTVKNITDNFLLAHTPQEIFNFIIFDFEKHDPRNFDRFYQVMESSLLRLYKFGKIAKDYTVECPLEDGSYLTFGICKHGATLDRTFPDGTVESIINESVRGKAEKTILTAILSAGHYTIGHPLPKEFMQFLLQDISVGTGIVFSGAGMYLCTDIQTDAYQGRTIDFVKCSDITDHESVDIHSFEAAVNKKNTIKLSLVNLQSVYDFYKQVKSTVSGNVVPRLCKDANQCGDLLIQRAKEHLSKHQTSAVTINLGKNRLILHKTENAYEWLDAATKKIIPEPLVRLYATYLKISPMKLKIFDGRKNTDNYQKACDEWNFRQKFEAAANTKDSSKIFNTIKNFCLEKSKEVKVELSGFVDVDSNETYEPKTYIFSENQGNVQMYEVVSSQKQQKEYRQIAPQEIKAFIDKKQQCEYKMIKLQTAKEILEKWKSRSPIKNSEQFEQHIDKLAKEKFAEYSAVEYDNIAPLEESVSAVINAFDKEKGERKNHAKNHKH